MSYKNVIKRNIGGGKARRRFISWILTFAMVITLTPMMGMTAWAATGDSWVGTESFDYAVDATGTGWTWDSTNHILTLSGVDASKDGDHGINVQGNTTIVLEGANKATSATSSKSALSCGADANSLTIEGSGTLEVSGTNATKGVIQCLDLTVNSGYITASSDKMAIRASRTMTVNGGYITASSTGSMNTVYAATYIQKGGYLKVNGGPAALSAENVTINGGYLELGGKSYGYNKGSSGGNFTNSGGVVKVTGGTNGINADAVNFTGGVTIASGSTAAISGTTSASNGEQVAALTDGVPGTLGTISSAITGNSVVVAKATSYASGDLNGHYIYNASGTAVTAAADITVAGGSYLECAGTGNSTAMYALNASTNKVTVDGTLVCISANTNFSSFNNDNAGVNKVMNVGANSTVFASSAGNTAIAGYKAENSGTIIGVSSSSKAVDIPILTVKDGYVCGISGGTTNFGVQVTGGAGLTVQDGYLTAVCSKIGLNAEKLSITGNGAVTAIGDTYAYEGAASNGSVTGATTKYQALSATEFDSSNRIYKVGDIAAKVVCFTPPAPAVFDDCFGNISSDSANPTAPVDSDYSFVGWFTDKTYITQVPSDWAAGTTYYAKWTNNGKTVVTTPLDFMGTAPTLPDDCGIIWNNNTLTLDGATIDCSAVTDCYYAINLPADAIVQLADSTTNTIKGGKGENTSGNLYSTALFSAGAFVISGNGTLNAYSQNVSGSYNSVISSPLYTTKPVTIGGAGSDPNVSAYAGTAETTITIADHGYSASSYGVPFVSVESGTVNLVGNTATVPAGEGYTAMSLGAFMASINGGTVRMTGITGPYGILSADSATVTGSSDYNADSASAPTYLNESVYYMDKDVFSIPAKTINISFGPNINITNSTEGDGTSVYGATNAKAFSITNNNFETVPETYNAVWCDETGITTGNPAEAGTLAIGQITEGNATLTLTPSATANAGTYYFKVNTGSGENVVSSNVITYTITKATATDAMKTATGSVSKDGATASTLNLPAIPVGGTVGTITYGGDIAFTNASVSGTTLIYDAPESTAEQTGTMTIPVTGCTNYEDYNIVVTITSVAKTPVTVSGAEAATGLVYNGNAQNGFTGEATVTDHTDLDTSLEKTYYLSDGSTKTNTANSGAEEEGLAPKNAGTYKLKIAVPDANATYVGSQEITFTLSKKALTIKPKALSITKGAAIPTFALEYSGIVGTETLTPSVTAEFTCYSAGTTPVDTSTVAGSYTITWANEAGTIFTDGIGKAENYTITKTATGILTISNPSSGGSSGSSTTTVTVPVKGDATSTNVTASVNGTTATIKAPTTAELNKVTEAAASADKPISIDTSGLNDKIKSTVLPGNTITAAGNSNVQGLQITMPDGSIVAFDKTAAKAIADAANGDTLTLMVDNRGTASADEKAALGGKTPVKTVDLSLVNSKGVKVSSFNDGNVTITAPNIELSVDPAKLDLFHIEGIAASKVDFTYTKTADNKYTIGFVTKSWSSYAFVAKEDTAEEEKPTDTNTFSFTDVNADRWSRDAIVYAYENNLFSGMTDTTFGPTISTTRGMLVTLLYRMEGSPTGAAAAGFGDVASGSYYEAAVNWGYANGVIEGFSATEYRPDIPVTREQMAAIMYRYSNLKKYDTSKTGSLSAFTDAASVSAYAKDAVIWANGEGLVTGMGDGTLNPGGDATREQVAAILQRYCVNISK